MCLTIHQNQLIFLVNDGRTTIWSTSEMKDLRHDACPVQEVHVFYIFGVYLRWSLLKNMTTHINTHCPRYLTFRVVGIFILMCMYGQIPFIYYDLNTFKVTHIGPNEGSLLPSLCFPMPIDNECTNIIMSKFFFPLTISIEGFDDFLPLPANWLESSEHYGI